VAKHVVHCAKRHIYRDRYEPGGPTVEVDDDYPDRIWVDGEMLRVESWEYRPAALIPQPDGTVYQSDPWIEAHLPAENGAVLTVGFYDGETNAVSLGRRGPGGWYPLSERNDRIEAHRGCLGTACDCNGGGTLNELGTSLFLPDILAAWQRIGSKPIETPEPRPVKPNVEAAPVVSELDRVIRTGRTVTLNEYREMTR
jgi:hypothetical protein